MKRRLKKEAQHMNRRPKEGSPTSLRKAFSRLFFHLW